jgi:hypothetical protein
MRWRGRCAGSGLRPRLLPAGAGASWQACIGQRERIFGAVVIIVAGFGGGDLFGLVEDAIAQLLAARREAFALRQAELFFELRHALTQLPVARLEFADIGQGCRRQSGEVVFVHACDDSPVPRAMGLRQFVTARAAVVYRQRRAFSSRGGTAVPGGVAWRRHQCRRE